MKYCVLKGIEGFGDRLQCLLYALQYCDVSKRQLVIDWRDKHWTQGTYIPIENFLKIKNIPTMDIQYFLSQKYKKNLTISNKNWNNLIDDDGFAKYIYNKKFKLEGNNKILDDIINQKIKDFSEDIVVYPGVGFRRYNQVYTKYIEFSNEIHQLVQGIYQEHNLIEGDYICIHIRATSKNWKQKKNMNHTLSRRMDLLFPSEEKYLELLYRRFNKIQEPKPVIIVYDCISTAKKWIDKHKDAILIHNQSIETQKQSGIHIVNFNAKDAMYKCKLNMLCLRDFCLMKNSKHIISDQISLFSKMANFFKND